MHCRQVLFGEHGEGPPWGGDHTRTDLSVGRFGQKVDEVAVLVHLPNKHNNNNVTHMGYSGIYSGLYSGSL
jgi:hypothetical protein